MNTWKRDVKAIAVGLPILLLMPLIIPIVFLLLILWFPGATFLQWWEERKKK